ncbi:hypothetical protein HKX48_004779 [Thoreauomyces humboldtii]|nr:hypothetical protein HKX48_004779 [Thoreauomyces humboldtii]
MPKPSSSSSSSSRTGDGSERVVGIEVLSDTPSSNISTSIPSKDPSSSPPPLSSCQKQQQPTNFLDMPDAQSQIASLLISQTPQQSQHPSTRPKTFKPDPPSALLSRVAAFLPQLSAANAVLDHHMDPSDLDIENLGDGDERYIEMNLGVGVFDTVPIGGASSGGEEEVHDRDIVMTTEPPLDPDARPLVQVVSSTSTVGDEEDEEESG